jgi:hypothetical protein
MSTNEQKRTKLWVDPATPAPDATATGIAIQGRGNVPESEVQASDNTMKRLIGKLACVAIPAVLLLSMLHRPSSGTTPVPSTVTNMYYTFTADGLPPTEVLSDLSAPLHDWTFRVQNRQYGVTSWGRSDCSFYFGRRVTTWNLAGTHVAAIAFSIVAFSGVVGLHILLKRR